MDKNELLDVFKFRHACKKFDPARDIQDDDFRTVLECGRLSPSSFGFEPWRFLVVRDMELKKKLAPVCWGTRTSIMDASRFMIILARTRKDLLADSAYITHMMRDVHHLPAEAETMRRSLYEGFQKNDFKLIESDRAFFDWACKQTYIALANMLTAAAVLGIDSCPIEGFNRDGVEAILSEAGLLKDGGSEDAFGVSVMACFGYRLEDPRAKTRTPFESLILEA